MADLNFVDGDVPGDDDPDIIAGMEHLAELRAAENSIAEPVFGRNLVQEAADLGADHAELEHNGGKARLHSGKQVADALLGSGHQLTGDEYVALRDSYFGGWSSFH